MIQRQQWAAAPGKRVNLHVGSGRMPCCCKSLGLLPPASEVRIEQRAGQRLACFKMETPGLALLETD